MKVYYSERAKEYEKVYFRDDDLRQQEQSILKSTLEKTFEGKEVLEVACGTGFWTQFVGRVANHITALDYSNEVLNIAKEKNIPQNKVLFCQGDAYQLDKVLGNFNGAMANFWFSHIPKSRTQEFLKQFNLRVGSGSTVFISDNMYIESIGGSLINKENDENTYKIRTLENGTQYEIIKNYYTQKELEDIFAPYSNNLKIHIGQCFWWLTYKIK